jgi:hypothetical protein
MLTSQNYIKKEGDVSACLSFSFANHVNGVTWDQPEPGYLTVVTRCYKRKEKLGINQRSLSNQSDGDWDQVCIHDEVGIGLHKANGLFHEYRNLVKGEYVLLLDDDDKIIDHDFIKRLKERDEDIVWFPMQARKIHAPPNDTFDYIGMNDDRQPKLGRIGGSCMVVKNHVYQRFIHLFDEPYNADFAFLKEIWKKKYGYTKHYLGDTPVTAIQSGAAGKGLPIDV